MEFNFSNAYTNLSNYKLASGAKVASHIADWYELYRDAFCFVLESKAYKSNEEYCRILNHMCEFKYIGDFLCVEHEQLAELSAFGLIILDQLNATNSTPIDLDWFFAKHEEIVECYGYVSNSDQRSAYARSLARKRHVKNNEAKTFVINEWLQHKDNYKGNKSAFSRKYIAIVKNKFDVTVTEKQMREVWLKHDPDAASR